MGVGKPGIPRRTPGVQSSAAFTEALSLLSVFSKDDEQLRDILTQIRDAQQYNEKLLTEISYTLKIANALDGVEAQRRALSERERELDARERELRERIRETEQIWGGRL